MWRHAVRLKDEDSTSDAVANQGGNIWETQVAEKRMLSAQISRGRPNCGLIEICGC